tara:strand:+ start:860 stop:1426 length:567 start_codon:yes stop_codon:yes gene_type:complete
LATLQNTTIPDGGTLGSVSDPDAISISSGGVVATSAELDVSGGTLTTSTAQKQAIAATAFGSGTNMLFQQTSAPTGWTKSTSYNNVALRVVSGTASSGGTQDFTTAFASQAIPSHTLSTSEMPSHNHSTKLYRAHGSANTPIIGNGNYGYFSTNSGGGINSTGGGGSHSHGSLNLAVSYVDIIIASKD